MKVEDLIYYLRGMPPDAEVLIKEPYDEGLCFDITNIDIDEDGDIIIHT